MYSIKPISADKRAALAAQIADDLTNWRSDLARFLDADLFSISQLIPIFQRQRNVLNLTYWHAVILTYRPFVLHNGDVPAAAAAGSTATTDGPTADEKVQKCLSAAMNIANTIREIVESRQLTAAFWITAYFAFSATIVLYVYVIQKGGRRASSSSSPSSTSPSSAAGYSEYLAAAIQCQSHISRFAEKGSLSERYFLVLEELRIEALRQTNGGVGAVNGGGVGGSSSSTAPLMYLHPDGTAATDITAGFIGSSATAAAPPLNFSSLPSAMPASAAAANTMIDSTEWEQFALMLSSGLGNLDVFNDSFYQE